MSRWIKLLPVVAVCCIIMIVYVENTVPRVREAEMIVPQPFENHPYNKYVHLNFNQFHNAVPEVIATNEHSLPYELILSEQEALRDKPCSDIKSSPSGSTSTIDIVGSKKTYNLGDKIRVNVQLKDGYGNRITNGGHIIHVTMSNSTLGAYSTGVVTDNLNGTYLVEFEALWTGQSELIAAIDYTRQSIAASYRLRRMYLTLNMITGKFTNGQFNEVTLCHPDGRRLLDEAHYQNVCNYTANNSGHQWYCGEPSNSKLDCKDWHHASYTYVKHKFPLTDCENSALSRVHERIRNSIHVHVTKQDELISKEIMRLPEDKCARYNNVKLWKNTGVTGFFYKNKWYIRNCQGVNNINIPQCLKDKAVYLFGDSTVRQWYTDMKNRFDCVQYTEKWTTPKWSKKSACKNEKYNFTITFASHNFPYNANISEDAMPQILSSVSKKMERIPSNQSTIILIHIFAHLWGYHHRYFIEKMVKLREGVEHFLDRNPSAKVLLKIPHTFTDTSSNGGKNDISSYVFIGVIKNVFKGLYGKIVYLDNRDATLAVNSSNLHPTYFVVSGMVNQMFSYVCE